MSPVGQIRPARPNTANNVYTAMLALAFGVVLATAIFVAFKCYSQYGSLFSLK